MPRMRRIERAAEEPDRLPGPVRRQAAIDAAPHFCFSGAGLAGAAHAIFEARQLLDPDGSASMHLSGGDADLGAHAELAPVSKLSRGIVKHDGRIDLRQE